VVAILERHADISLNHDKIFTKYGFKKVSLSEKRKQLMNKFRLGIVS
jgi:hypothetical protein